MKTKHSGSIWISALVFIALFLAVLAITSRTNAQSTCGSTYTVQSGDTLSAIAARCGVSLPALEQANPAITNPRLILTGTVLNIPQSSASPSTYTVQAGDTLSGIAARLGVTLSALEAANPQITNPSLIITSQVINTPAAIPVTGSAAQVGLNPTSGQSGAQVTVTGSGFPANTILDVTVASGSNPPSVTASVITDDGGAFTTSVAIPSDAPASSMWTVTAKSQAAGGPSASANFEVASPPPSGAYSVQAGDTLTSLAARFNTTVNALLRANPQVTNPNLLTAGEVLNIPGSTVVINGQTIYVVKSGDDLSAIAAAHNVTLAALEQANAPITDPSLIFPGQRFVIP